MSGRFGVIHDDGRIHIYDRFDRKSIWFHSVLPSEIADLARQLAPDPAPAPPAPESLAALQAEVSAWGKATFPTSTPLSIARHLEEEAAELVAAIGSDPDDRDDHAEEAADCFLLLIQIAEREGFDLMDAARRKFAVNQQRAWEPAEGGYWKHAADAPEPVAQYDENVSDLHWHLTKAAYDLAEANQRVTASRDNADAAMAFAAMDRLEKAAIAYAAAVRAPGTVCVARGDLEWMLNWLKQAAAQSARGLRPNPPPQPVIDTLTAALAAEDGR